MSWIVLPDMHPGRCRNLRPSSLPYSTFRRCLDYEDPPHVCTFEPENPAERTWAAGALSTAEPRPWVKPE